MTSTREGARGLFLHIFQGCSLVVSQPTLASLNSATTQGGDVDSRTQEQVGFLLSFEHVKIA